MNGSGRTRRNRRDGGGPFKEVLAAGVYSVRISAPGFATATQQVTVTSGQASPLDVALDIVAAAAEVDVTSASAGAINVDPSQNAGAIVLTEADLDALPDDPDDLEAQLTAMAGPAAGANGHQDFFRGVN